MTDQPAAPLAVLDRPATPATTPDPGSPDRLAATSPDRLAAILDRTSTRTSTEGFPAGVGSIDRASADLVRIGGGVGGPGVAGRRRRWLRLAGVAVGIVLAGVALRQTLPRFADVLGALRTADGLWLAAAFLAQAASMSMFAHQQRRLLAAFGVRMSRRRALALTYTRTAISIAMPAGAALASGFAFRQFRARGADARTAATVMIVSGVQSTAALVLLYLAWGAAVTVAGPAWRHPGIAASVLAGIAVTAWFLLSRPGSAARRAGTRDRRLGTRDHTPATQDRLPEPDPARRAAGARRAVGVCQAGLGLAHRGRHRPAVRRGLPEPFGTVARRGRTWVVAGIGAGVGAVQVAASMSWRDWAFTGGSAAVNWVTDLACLAAVGQALGLPLGIVQLTGAYLAVQLVRQVPVTPGGIGLIEASLLVALVAAGAAQGTAAAVIIVYRLLSCWIIVPVGLLTWAALRGER